MMSEPAAKPGLRRRTALLLLALFSVPFLVAGLHQAWYDSPTFDEPLYVAAGVTALTRHDLRINPEHPPLAKAVAALPVLLVHPVVPAGSAWARADQYGYGAAFLRAQLPDRLRAVTFASRLLPLAEAVAAAFLIYALAAALFTPAAGLLAGGLWLASPLTLGLGHLNGIDLPFTVATLALTLALLGYLRRPGLRTAALLGLAGGAALLTRHTALILVPLALLTAAVTRAAAGAAAGAATSPRPGLGEVAGPARGRGRAVGEMALAAGVAWGCLWAGYAALAPGTLRHLGWAPASYLTGISRLRDLALQPGTGFLFGETWEGRQWWYWPGGLALKLPTATLLLMLAASWGWRRVPRRHRRLAAMVVLVPALALGAFTIAQPRTIGIRYLLPVLALLLVCAAPVAYLATSRARRMVLGGLAVLSVGSAVASAPHSLAWTQPPLTPAYRFATNSDVDWGQDLYRLQAWSADRRPFVAYFGPRGLSPADVPGARPLIGANPRTVTGWVAASATLLTGEPASGLGWLRAYCPVGTLGGSVLLYFFRDPPTAEPGPTAPPPRCAGGVSTRVRAAASDTVRP